MISSTKDVVNTKDTGMSTDAISRVSDRIAKAGFGEYRVFKVDVYVTKMLKELASTLVMMCQHRNPMFSATDSDVEKFLRTLVALRCKQITRNLPKGIDNRDVPVPDFFRPFLAYINRYESSFQALEIVPEWGSPAESDGKAEKTEGMVTDVMMDMTQIRNIGRLLKVSGVRVTDGLPRELVTTDDSIFRVCEGPTGDLLVAGSDVNEAVLLVRSVVRMSFLSEIFGAARTRYLGVEECTSALDIVLSSGFVQ